MKSPRGYARVRIGEPELCWPRGLFRAPLMCSLPPFNPSRRSIRYHDCAWSMRFIRTTSFLSRLPANRLYLHDDTRKGGIPKRFPKRLKTAFRRV